MKVLRLFFSVRPPQDVRERLWCSLAPLRESTPGVRWVPPERYHITLRFLGDVSADLVPRLVSAAGALEREPPFRASLADMGTFPRHAAPRVYWVGARARQLLRIRDRLDGALAQDGLPRDGRIFAPHLTVGRAKPGRTMDGRTGGEGSAAARGADRVGFTVEAVHLVRSELFPGGPRYANVHRFVLSGREG